MIASTERGILVTRFWYIREVDPYEKIFTGMTRDGTFLIEGGRVTGGVRNFRFNQGLMEMLSNVEALSPAVRASGEEAGDMVVPAMKVRRFQLHGSDALLSARGPGTCRVNCEIIRMRCGKLVLILLAAVVPALAELPEFYRHVDRVIWVVDDIDRHDGGLAEGRDDRGAGEPDRERRQPAMVGCAPGKRDRGFDPAARRGVAVR